MEEILPCWIGRESAACAVGRGNVQFHQKSMDPRRENWRLSSMGWSEVVVKFPWMNWSGGRVVMWEGFGGHGCFERLVLAFGRIFFTLNRSTYAENVLTST